MEPEIEIIVQCHDGHCTHEIAADVDTCVSVLQDVSQHRNLIMIGEGVMMLHSTQKSYRQLAITG